ncbi:MAG TPA: proline racemase family protein [Solirubrobacteraceae bacterium]|jgi:proline racemase|nr:proline racemase family protein [Solirubrobacteraceae bacterium]
MDLETTDYHTAGEPFRIVTGGAPEIPGATVRERREHARRNEAVDALRRLLCHEPRGHADMYGCFLVPPDDEGADLGVLFWHKDGYSTACGHGTIALGVWAAETGLVDGELTLDVPSGRVVARRTADGVAFRNVPAYVLAREVPVAPGVTVDLAYGGAIYACVPAAAFGLGVRREDLTALIAAGREVKRALEGSGAARHASDDRLSGVYGTIFYEQLGDGHQRNVTVFADGEVDRSPCGSGTSARVALLDADGRLDGDLVHESIVGTTFRGRVVDRVTAEGRDAVITEVEGMAYRTGEHRFTLDPADPLGTGFVLR